MSILIELVPVSNTQGKTFKDVNIAGLMDDPVNNDLNSIKNRIENIFDWEQGSRILRPELGNLLNQIKYEQLNEVTLKNADALTRKMLSFEPEISVVSVDVKANYDSNEVNISVQYEIPKLDIVTNTSLNVKLAGEK